MELEKLFEETAAAKADARKRIDALIDGQSFVETDVLIRTETPLGAAAGEGVVGGFASIDGLRVVVFATNPAVLKGSIGGKAADKIVRLTENAVRCGAPVVALFDTSGARFAEGTEAVSGYARILGAFADAYGQVPVIVVNYGNNLGLLSYLAAYCDCCIGCEKSVSATASPLVLAAKAGLGAEEVGTAKALSAAGLYSFVVGSDAELKAGVSSVLSYLTEADAAPSDDPNRTISGQGDMRAILAETFDAGTFCEMRAGSGKEAITGFARLDGTAVGVIASDAAAGGGRITADGAVKITELLNTCANAGLPVVHLVDCAGSAYDAKNDPAYIREIGNMIYTLHETDIPKVAVVTGQAIGLGYAAFADRSVCDYVAAWKSARIGAMEDSAAAELLYAKDIAAAKDKKKAEAAFAEKYSEENLSAAVSAAAGYVDNVIEPEFTRQYLISAVAAFAKR